MEKMFLVWRCKKHLDLPAAGRYNTDKKSESLDVIVDKSKLIISTVSLNDSVFGRNYS